MKKYLFLFTALGLLFLSCSDNDDKKKEEPVAEIISVSLPVENISEQLYKELQVEPVIELSDGKADTYTYKWEVYDQNTLVRVISTEQNLKFVIENIQAGRTYTLIFTIKSETTDIEKSAKANLTITSLATGSNGWYVLRTLDGKTDVDFFSNLGDTVATSFFNSLYGITLDGEAGDLAYGSIKDKDSPESTDFENGRNRLMVASKTEMIYYDPQAAIITRRNLNEIFYTAPNPADIQKIAVAANGYVVENKGKLHKLYNITARDGMVSDAVTHPEGLTYEYDIHPEFMYYRVDGLYFFDKTSRSFLWMMISGSGLNYFPSDPTQLSLKNMDYEMLYCGVMLPGYSSSSGFALMKKQNEDEYIVLELHNQRPDGSDYPVKNKYDVAATSGLAKAEIRAQSITTPAMYFIEGNSIKSHNFLDGKETLLYSFPAGETPTFLKPAIYYLGRYPGENATGVPYATRYLTAAVQIGNTYKAYVFDVEEETGQIVGGAPIKTFEGKGIFKNIKEVNNMKYSEVNYNNSGEGVIID